MLDEVLVEPEEVEVEVDLFSFVEVGEDVLLEEEPL